MGSSSSTNRNSNNSGSSTSSYPATRNRPPRTNNPNHRDSNNRRSNASTTSATSNPRHSRNSSSSSNQVPSGRVVAPRTSSPMHTSSPSSATAHNAHQQQPQQQQATAMSRPGAYSISRSNAGPTQVFRVQIPLEVLPGQEFQVIAGTRTVRVRCPNESRGGQYLQITVPPEPVVTAQSEREGMAVLTSVGGSGSGGAVPMTEDVVRANEERQMQQLQQQQQLQQHQQQSQGQQQQQQQQPPTTYMVTVPPGIMPGMQFAVDVEGQRMMVTCPANVQAGMNLRILPPSPSQSAPPNLQNPHNPNYGTSLDRPPDMSHHHSAPPSPPMMQMFEVIVPPGVQPNQPFSLLANGQRVLVTCPSNVRPGQKIRFQLPISNPNDGKHNPPAIQLSYESIKDNWARTIRVTDMKFQWIRMNELGEVDSTSGKFDLKHSAYTRKLTFLEGNDPRMRTGELTLVNANESSVDSHVEMEVAKIVDTPQGRREVREIKEVVGYAEIAEAHRRGSYEAKAKWFQEICNERLRVDWNDGHMRINVRRSHLLHDSIQAIMSLSRTDLLKTFRFEFLNEIGIDAGGLAREWFTLITHQLFNPDIGLFLSASATHQSAMRINPASEISCPEDHLIYFRFLGRVCGKALFDGQLCPGGHMVRYVYKHILGWPITFEDLELADEEYYNNLKKLLEVEDVANMCLDFTFTEDALGMNKVVDLIEGGADVEVTNENLSEYLEANLKYLLLDRVKPQLTELLLGFYDVIPEPLLTIFDFQELELLMCGMPVIDLEDWKNFTIYQGYFEHTGEKSRAVQWFWEVVRDEFDQETRARLLQFVTGTSGVPSRGFSVLQGNDGNIRQFCINGVTKEFSLYPRAHTCFNRLDLPMYSSKDELREKLKVAIATSATGFDIE